MDSLCREIGDRGMPPPTSTSKSSLLSRPAAGLPEAVPPAPAPALEASSGSTSMMAVERAPPVVHTVAPKRPVLVDELAMGDNIDWLERSERRSRAAAPLGRGSGAKRGKPPRGKPPRDQWFGRLLDPPD